MGWGVPRARWARKSVEMAGSYGFWLGRKTWEDLGSEQGRAEGYNGERGKNHENRREDPTHLWWVPGPPPWETEGD
jgi:hypothetical protein